MIKIYKKNKAAKPHISEAETRVFLVFLREKWQIMNQLALIK